MNSIQKRRLVDSHINCYLLWLEGLWKEDIKEVGCSIYRSETELRRLYSVYFCFQDSDFARQERVRRLRNA